MIKVRTKHFWYVGYTVFFSEEEVSWKVSTFYSLFSLLLLRNLKKKKHKKKILKKNQEIADIVYMWIYNLNCYHPRRNIGLIYIHSLPPPPIWRISVYHTFVINNTCFHTMIQLKDKKIILTVVFCFIWFRFYENFWAEIQCLKNTLQSICKESIYRFVYTNPLIVTCKLLYVAKLAMDNNISPFTVIYQNVFNVLIKKPIKLNFYRSAFEQNSKVLFQPQKENQSHALF